VPSVAASTALRFAILSAGLRVQGLLAPSGRVAIGEAALPRPRAARGARISYLIILVRYYQY